MSTRAMFDALRLRVALAHTVRRAELRITTPLGPHPSVGAHRGDEVHICGCAVGHDDPDGAACRTTRPQQRNRNEEDST